MNDRELRAELDRIWDELKNAAKSFGAHVVDRTIHHDPAVIAKDDVPATPPNVDGAAPPPAPASPPNVGDDQAPQ